MDQVYLNSRHRAVRWTSVSDALVGLAHVFDRKHRQDDISSFEALQMRDLARRLIRTVYAIGTTLDQLPRPRRAVAHHIVQAAIVRSDLSEERANWGWNVISEDAQTLAQIMRSTIMTATSLRKRDPENLSDSELTCLDAVSDTFFLNWDNPIMRMQMVGRQRTVPTARVEPDHPGMEDPSPMPGM